MNAHKETAWGALLDTTGYLGTQSEADGDGFELSVPLYSSIGRKLLAVCFRKQVENRLLA
jgi:hypothetical protein